MDVEIIFQIGAIIFGIFSFIFLFFGRKKTQFSTEFFISFITATSYALMSLSIATTDSLDGQTIYWSRWLFYLVSCPLLIYDISIILKISNEQYSKLALLTGFTMLNGFLASYIVTSSRWIFFILSSLAFICLLYSILQGRNNPSFRLIKPFIFIGWSLFPVVFLLAPTGIGIIETSISEALYLILDLITKLVFGMITLKQK
jgi:bacteriorhodopsin